MKISKENLWDRLLNRLPANDALRDTRVLKRAGCVTTPDYLDVKAMSELVETYRDRAWKALGDYRRWEIEQSARRLSATARRREGELLRRRALDCASLHRDARRDYHDLVEIAMRPYRESVRESGI